MAMTRESQDPIVGWKSWVVRHSNECETDPMMVTLTEQFRPLGKGSMLVSPIMKKFWEPRQRCEAWCRCEQSPCGLVYEGHCAGGINAWRSRETMLRYQGTPVYTPYGDRVYGRVLLWGRVVEHEQGYRAQYAYPDELWVVPNIVPIPRLRNRSKNLVKHLAQTYLVPCGLWSDGV